MRLADVEQTKAQLRPFLRAFLASRGVDINARGFFKCIAHNEDDASAHLVPGTDDMRWTCFGCEAGGDIFDAAHYTDGTPEAGPGWFSETLPKLAAEFSIPLKYSGALTEAEQKEFDTYQAYEMASRLVLTGKRSDLVEMKLAEYGWSKRTLRVFGIGGVQSYSKFLAALVKAGYSKEFLAEVGLADEPNVKSGVVSKMFRPESLIFTIKDPAGRAIGFSSRYLNYERDQETLAKLKELKGADSEEYKRAAASQQQKYLNTSSKNPLFRKREVLLGFHSARNSKSIYVFEGNADCVTAFDAGLVNSTAICGATFSATHLNLALDAGVRHFIFVMDGDEPGRKATGRIVELCRKELANRPDVRVEIVDLPFENGVKTDPDLFIRTKKLQAFRALPRRSYLYWHWAARVAESDGVTVADEGTRQIVEQPDPLLRYDMLMNLCDITRIPMEFLWDAVVRKAAGVKTETAERIVKSARYMAFLQEQKDQAKKLIVEVSAVCEVPEPKEPEPVAPPSMEAGPEPVKPESTWVFRATSLEPHQKAAGEPEPEEPAEEPVVNDRTSLAALSY